MYVISKTNQFGLVTGLRYWVEPTELNCFKVNMESGLTQIVSRKWFSLG
jgi:hypothetical protein